MHIYEIRKGYVFTRGPHKNGKICRKAVDFTGLRLCPAEGKRE